MPDPPSILIDGDPSDTPDPPARSYADLLQGCATRLLEAISIGEPLPDLLRTIALGVEEIVPAAQVSILLVDRDGVHLRHGAAPSLPEPYVRAIDGRQIGPRAGSCGTAVYRREPAIATDIASDERWVDYRALALGHGLRACWSTPVRGADGEILAAFAVYHRQPRTPTADDLELLDRMAYVVRIAIERDRKEQELRQSQALLNMASRVSRLGAWSIDLPGSDFAWSDEARAIHEVDPGVVPALGDLIAFYVPEDRPTIRALFDACIRDGVPFDAELRFLTARGRPCWVRVIGEAVRDESGAIVRVHGALQDITAPRQAEQDRQRLAQRLNATLERMTDAFCLVDPAWRFLYMNGEAERILGRTRADLMGRDMWDEFPEGRQTLAWNEYHHAMAEGQARHFEMYYPPIDRWLEITADPLPDGLAIYFGDVTDRRRADAILRESEERFRLLSRATSDVIWDWTLANDAIWWNDGMQILFGYEPDEVEQSFDWWAGRIHPDDRERVTIGLRRATETGRETWTDEYRFARRDGSYARIQDRGSLIFDAAGTAIRMVGGMTDATRQFELEAQLRQAQRLEAVGQLTGGIAHDFNNLLTVILGNADLLAGELADQPEQRTLAEIITSAAQRGAALTHRLLAFARQQPLDPRPVDVNHLVDGMEPLLRRTLGEHIEIAIVREADLGLALVDPVQLEHALLNLCVNARDAMPDGGHLTIETASVTLDEAYAARHADVQPGPYVLLAVSDTGVGMPPEVQAHVFDPFFTTKEIGKGTGLGLAMVYGFLKQSGGHVALYSEPGHGTTIRLYLPHSADALAFIDAGQPEPEALVGGTETILLVEDEAPVRQYAATQLTALGYRVIQAEDGHQALDVLRQRPDVALLLTDVVLPGGLSGPMVAAQALALRPDLRVLYTSGYTANAMLHHGRLDAGAPLLPKPYRRLELARKVRTALS